MTTEIVPATSPRDMSNLRTKSLLSGMSKRHTDLESQRRECRRWFSDLQSGTCAHCGRVIVASMTRHVMACHLWRCLVPWCSIWKGTIQDCVEHVRLRHHGGMSVKASTIGKCFPSGTVMAWNAALKPTVSGIATDIMLFTQHGARLVHRYRVYGGYVPHHSPRGSFMSRLSDFTHWDCAEAHLAAKRGRDSSTVSHPSPVRPAPMPLWPIRRTPDHVPPRPGRLRVPRRLSRHLTKPWPGFPLRLRRCSYQA